MHWYARPENHFLQLRVEPRLASWNKAGDPSQVRLRDYLDDTEALLGGSQIGGPWGLRLDVGLPATRNLLDAADLDNYAYPLADRIGDPRLVSVWCTKQHQPQSYVRIDAAREVPPPLTGVVVVEAPSAKNPDYKERVYAAVADAAELPDGAVRLELAFVVGPGRNWLELWKPTIDALEPLLGRDSSENRAWHPRDGRITELGMHFTVDHAARHEVVVGINAVPGRMSVSPYGRFDLNDRVLIDEPGTRVHRRAATIVGLGPGEGAVLEIGQLSFGMPTNKLTVIDRRLPEGAVITDLVGHDGPCRDTEGTPGRCDVIMAWGYTTPDDRELRSFRCGQPCKPRPEDSRPVPAGRESQNGPQPAAPADPESQDDPHGDAQIILRAAARANGWQVLTANNREDTYLLPSDPDNRIRVIWSAGGDVLFAYGGAGSFISRFDGYPYSSAKTERVLSALQGRTDVIPSHRPNDPAVGHDSTPERSQPPTDGLVDQELLRATKVDVQNPGPLEFRDDDVGYLAWLAAHPNGYVINIARSHSKSAARVHHAGCRTISGQNPHKGPWTGPYVKVCAEQLADLEQWATDNVREPIPLCGICHPGSALQAQARRGQPKR